jgi:hypothetical protein
MGKEKDVKNETKKYWVVAPLISKMATQIFDSNQFQIAHPDHTQFYLTSGVKKVKSKKFKVSVLDPSSLEAELIGNYKFYVAIDEEYWNEIQGTEQYYLIAHILHYMSINVDGKAGLCRPDVKEFKELLTSDYIDVGKITSIMNGEVKEID